jgi:phosphatidylserine/phosphatidylglycerophosphate/cardiolipin synthase-like enzyme
MEALKERIAAYLSERPALLLGGLLALAGLFCAGSYLVGSDPVQIIERWFAPVWFVTSDTGGASDWYEVYMTNPPQVYDPQNFVGDVPQALIRKINGAQHSLDIAAFEFNLDPVAEAVINAHRRGVAVRWLTDDEHGLEADGEEGRGQFQMMIQAGIPVRDDDRNGLMHNKFIIFDESSVWTGSTNLTVNGLFRNNNNVLFFDSPEIAKRYRREFNELWRGESGAESRSTVRRQTAMLDETPVFVIFAPEDSAMNYLVPLVRQAEDSIYFMAFAFTHDELGQELVRKARRGLDVRGVFESRNTNDVYSELNRLACQGVDVREDGNPATMHHKVFIIDDKIVVTGSFNFSNNANQTNDENMVFLNNDAVAGIYHEEFERVWSEAWVPQTGDLICP